MGLKSINRTLTCKVTGKEIIVKPDKYEKLFNYYGSEKKIKENFVCYHVEVEVRNPNLEFWFKNSVEMTKFEPKLIKIFRVFKDSNRSGNDATVLQQNSLDLMRDFGIGGNNVEFVQSSDEKGNFVSGLKIKNIPFIKEHTISWNS